MNVNKDYSEVFAFIVPTGIGASVGGYAGDASQWARKFANIRPAIVNANVVNAACFSGVNENILYSEGWGIDELFAGNLGLLPSQNNKIGVIFDKAIPKDVLNIHINTINAVKTVYGIEVTGYEITDEEVGVTYEINESGASSGGVKHPKTMLEAGKRLLKNGADTLAVVCLFPEEDDEETDKNYANGCGVDPIGGVESIISHYISQNLFVPCVHAPAFKDFQIKSDLVDARAAAEYITPTFLPCLLLGLKDAPLYISQIDKSAHDNKTHHMPIVLRDNIKALIIPSTSLGSSAVFDALENNITVYAVKENKTILNVTNDIFFRKNGIIEIDTYEELYQLLRKKYAKKI